MESNTKYFESSKKRNLSDGSKTSEKPIKLKEIISTSSMTEDCDLYNDVLDSEGRRGVLLNCSKKLRLFEV